MERLVSETILPPVGSVVLQVPYGTDFSAIADGPELVLVTSSPTKSQSVVSARVHVALPTGLVPEAARLVGSVVHNGARKHVHVEVS